MIEHIQKIEEMASLLMSITDMAALLGIAEIELRERIADANSAISKAYKKGKAQTIYELRKQEITLAKIAVFEWINEAVLEDISDLGSSALRKFN